MAELSIVIPCRNAAGVLPNQLRALASEQAAIDWEVVVVDNASDDGTWMAAQEFRDDLDLRVVYEPKRGRHHACNRGVDAAQADLIAFVDADDVVLPGYVQAMYSALLTASVVGGQLVHTNGPDDGVAFGNVQADSLMPTLGFLPFASGANLGVSRQAFLDTGGFADDIPYGEDIDLSWRLILAGFEISFESAARVRYNQRPNLLPMFTQHRRFGRAHAFLFAKYAGHGMPRRKFGCVRDDWKIMVGALPHLRDRDVRARWVRRTARSIGRFEGSMIARRLYL